MSLKEHSEKLIHFTCVAQYKSFRLAAKAVHLSQPALSQSIQTLEHALNVCLFYRSKQGVQLTHEGEILHEFSLRWFNAIEDIEKKILSPKNAMAGNVRFASYPSLLSGCGVDLVLAAKKKFPSLNIKLCPNNSTHGILNCLINFDADYALMIEPEKNSSLQFIPLYEEHYAFYTQNQSSGAVKKNKTSLSLHELEKIPLMYFKNALVGGRKILQDHLAEHGLHQKSNDFTQGSYDNFLELAYKGYGLVLAPTRVVSKSAYKHKLRHIRVSSLPKKIGSHTAYLAFRKESAQKTEHESIIHLIKKSSL